MADLTASTTTTGTPEAGGASAPPADERPKDQADLEARLAAHRSELTGYCYRMLGSSFEAEDAVQETFVRAWRFHERFEGRSAFRSWLYRIATNVCFDMLNGRQRRALPMDLGPRGSADSPPGRTLPEETWVEPVPDDAVVLDTPGADPADLAVHRESIRLAFVTAIQRLPAKQRAVLLLREVLRWKAEEVADLLGTSVPAVNSALQRARATLAEDETIRAGGGEVGYDLDASVARATASLDDDHADLLARYVQAFEAFDMESLVSLLHEDAIHSMPPFPLWLQGSQAITAWMAGPGAECRGSRLLATTANGMPAFAQYRVSQTGPGHDAWCLQVLDIIEGKVAGITYFLDTERLFPRFGLPLHLDPED
ncbi:MAG TPA: sigma-70 family RNA polymerase sigma factor [Acidimicrobiales bacterium]